MKNITDLLRHLIENISFLTPREFEVFELMAQGYSNIGVSSQLGLSVRTVEVHARTILDKLTQDTDTAGSGWNVRVACAAAYFYHEGQKSAQWIRGAGKTELSLWTSAVSIAAPTGPVETILERASNIYEVLVSGPRTESE
jgi:DNA-binding CsgD family transcriptional regulator